MASSGRQLEIEDYVASKNFTSAQTSALIEFVLLLNAKKKIPASDIFNEYQREYEKTLVCKNLGVKNAKQFLSLISDFIANSGGHYQLTTKGFVYVQRLMETINTSKNDKKASQDAEQKQLNKVETNMSRGPAVQPIPQLAGIPPPSAPLRNPFQFTIPGIAMAGLRAQVNERNPLPFTEYPTLAQAEAVPKTMAQSQETPAPRLVPKQDSDDTKSKSKFVVETSTSSKVTPPGGEPFLLETEILELAGNPAAVSKERLDALARKNIELIAEEGEFVTPRRVELMLCRQLRIRSFSDLRHLHLRRGIDDLTSIQELSRKIGQVEAHITASVALRNVNTLADLLDCVRDGIADKKPYESLKLGPITKNPTVQKIFSVPSGSDVVDISCIDIYSHLRDYVRANDLWRTQIKIEDFMHYLKEHYDMEDVFALGVKIRSLPLCMQTLKRAQRQEGEAIRGFYATMEENCKKDLDSAYKSFRTKLMLEGNGGFTTRDYYLGLDPKEVVTDVLNKFQLLIDTAQNLGVTSLDKERNAIKTLERNIQRTKIVKDLFKFAVVHSSHEIMQTVRDFLDEQADKKAEAELKNTKKERIPKTDVIERLTKYFENLQQQNAGLSLEVLSSVEKKCFEHFKRDSFIDLGHESFIHFLLKNDRLSKYLIESGGLASGRGHKMTSVYRPMLNDLVEMLLPIAELKDPDVIEKVACHHYKAKAFKHLGLGPVKLVQDRLDHVSDQRRNVVCEAASCHDSKIMDLRSRHYGIFGAQSVEKALKCLHDCPLLEEMDAWSQWELVFSNQHGNLKDFIEKNGGSRMVTFGNESFNPNLAALEIEPGKLLKLTADTNDDIFREVVEEGNVAKVCGHLVSLIVSHGFKAAGLALWANIIRTHLHKLCAVIPGAPPCEDSKYPAVMFVRDCLCLLPLMFCEKIADDLFLAPLSEVLGSSESKNHLARSCQTRDQCTRLAVLSNLLGIDQWQSLFELRCTERDSRLEPIGATDSEGDDSSESESSDEEDQENDEESGTPSPISDLESSSSEQDEEDNREIDVNEDSVTDKDPDSDLIEDTAIEEVLLSSQRENVNKTVSGEKAVDVKLAENDSLHDTDEPNSEILDMNEDGEAENEVASKDSENMEYDDSLIEENVNIQETTENVVETNTVNEIGKGEMEENVQNNGDVFHLPKTDDDLADNVIEDGEAENETNLSDKESDGSDAELTAQERKCKKIIKEIRRDRFGIGVELNETSRKLLDTQQCMIERCLQRLSQDLYTKDTHFVLELVQNADDNSYDVKCPSMHFVIEKEKITILNNEIGFQEKHVKALCDVGNSTKSKHQVGFIGQKGIGFKSVFRITDRPEIHSNGFHFCFDMQEDEIGYILPHWIEHEGYSTKWETKIVLPLKKEMMRSIDSLINRFKDIHPSLLLFLHRLKSLTIENKITGKKKKIIRRDISNKIIEIKSNKRTEQWLVIRQRLDVTKLEIKVKGGAEVEETEIALAFPLGEGQSGDDRQTPDKQPVFAFLPLRHYGFRFVVQADFDLPSSREDLDSDSAWNQWLRKEIAPAFVSALTAFQSINHDPVQAVKHYLLFVSREDEVMEFFKPCAKAIFLQLSSRAFLPNTNGVAKLPSQLVLGADTFLRETFTNEMLEKYLNLSYIHPDLVSEKNRQLLLDLGVQSLTSGDLLSIIEALSRDWEGSSNECILNEIARILVCIHRNVDDLDVHDRTFDAVKELKIIPDCRQQLLALNDQAIFFPMEQKMNQFDQILANDLNFVNPKLLTILQNSVANSQVKDVLEKLGVKQISPREVIEHHIIPTYANGKWQDKSKNTLLNYLVFLREFQTDLQAVISWQDLSEIIQLATTQGWKNPLRDAVHFTVEYGNSQDLKRRFPSYDWCLLSPYPVPKGGNVRDIWRPFFTKLGVQDFLTVRKVVKVLKSDDLDDSPWANLKTLVDDNVTLEIIDYESEELTALIGTAPDPTETFRQMQHLFEALSNEWRLLERYTTATITTLNREVPSSFHHLLTSVPWLPGFVEECIDDKIRRKDDLYLPNQLYSQTGNVRHCLAFHVPYLETLNDDLRNMQEFMRFLKIKDNVDQNELKEHFLKWTKEEEFVTRAEHLRNVYLFMKQRMSGADRDQLFRRNKAIFVPNSSKMSEFVRGQFLSLDEVCWSDQDGLFAKYEDELKNSSVKPIRTLSQYRHLYPNKPHEDIREYPSYEMYRDLLEYVCTYYPRCSDRIDDVMKIYSILDKCIRELPPRDWVRDFDKKMIIPTERDVYVRLSDQPMIADTEQLTALFSKEESVHILNLCPGKYSKRNQRRKTHGNDDIMRFFTDILRIRPLSEYIQQDVVAEGIQSYPELQNYFHHFVPRLQQHLYHNFDYIYDELVQIQIEQLLQTFKFFTVFKLEALFNLKLSNKTIPRVENRNFHIHEDFVYVQKDAVNDDQDIQKSIAEYFSFGNPDSLNGIHLFLMTNFPTIRDPTKTRGYKLQPLPDDEPVWEVKEAVIFRPPPPPPVNVPIPSPAPVEQEAEVKAEPVLRCWPPPAPGSGNKTGQSVEANWPKPPKPDQVDGLPERLQKRDEGNETRAARPLAHSDSHGAPTVLHSKQVNNEEGRVQSESPSDGRSASKRRGEPSTDVADSHSSSSEQKSDQSDESKNKVYEPKVPGDFIPPVTAQEKKTNSEVPVSVGPLPQVDAHGPVQSTGGNKASQAVRQFRPEEIDDIPDDRVFYETCNRGEISSLVEIQLGGASEQKEIGRRGEEIIYKFLINRVGKAHDDPKGVKSAREEIIKSVKWMNEMTETGLPYDIELKTQYGDAEKTHFIEVKTTVSESKMYFETSVKEILFAQEQKENYDLYRVFSVGNKDKISVVKLRNVAEAFEEKSVRVFMVV